MHKTAWRLELWFYCINYGAEGDAKALPGAVLGPSPLNAEKPAEVCVATNGRLIGLLVAAAAAVDEDEDEENDNEA